MDKVQFSETNKKAGPQTSQLASRLTAIPWRFLSMLMLMCGTLWLSANFADFASAQVLSLPSADKYGLPTSGSGSAVTQARGFTATLMRYGRILLGSVAVFLIVLAAFQMILAQGNEDNIQKQKTSLLYGVIGLGLVSISGQFEKILSLEGGGVVASPQTILERTGLFNAQVQVVITFIKYIIGSIAVFMLISSALTLLTSGSNEENVTKAKSGLTWSAVGLVLMIIADNVVNNVLFNVSRNALPGTSGSQASISVARGLDEIVGFTNYALILVGPVLVLLVLAGGVLYVTSGGDEERTGRAKKIIISALIGMVIVYGAFALVSTFLIGEF